MCVLTGAYMCVRSYSVVFVFVFASCDDDFRSVYISFIKISYQLSILMFMVRLAYVRQLDRNVI